MTLNQQISAAAPVFSPTQRQKENRHEQSTDSRDRFDER